MTTFVRNYMNGLSRIISKHKPELISDFSKTHKRERPHFRSFSNKHVLFIV